MSSIIVWSQSYGVSFYAVDSPYQKTTTGENYQHPKFTEFCEEHELLKTLRRSPRTSERVHGELLHHQDYLHG